ncbi:MAG TPA: lamin tail domain-containing protein [Bacilli bacterium]|nr:lamin tail domain-containing protein [Bacilli bacterium]
MKRIFGFLLSLVFLFAFACFFVEAKAETDVRQIEITYIYDDENVSNTPIEAQYGSVFVHTFSSKGGYDFAYWVVNGIVRADLPSDYEFTVSTKMNLQAVFSKENVYTVLFIDSNGELIDYQFVMAGEDATAPSEDGLVGKPGMKIAETNTWKTQTGRTELENVNENLVFVLQYELEKEGTYTLTVDGEEQGEFGYNQVAVATTAPEKDGVPFSHWEEDGHRLSYDREYAITMLKDRNLTPVYSDEIVKMPLVAMSDVYDLREDAYSFVGQYYLPEGYALVEAGFLLSDKAEVLKKDDEGVETVLVPTHNITTNEFLMSISQSAFKKSIRAYLVVKDGEGKLLTVHSNNQQGLVFGGAEDLFISEYIEGSSNNKAIEIYNGTGKTVNLSEYEIKLYSNGASSPSKTLKFEAVLESGKTYVIAHESANATIQNVADITSTFADFNGDDAIGLYKNGELIDVFGEIGVREEWGEDVTLVRKPEIIRPSDEYDEEEWIEYPKNTFTYLGKHTMESGQSDFGKFQIDLYPKVNGAQDKTILEGQSFDPLEGITAVDDTDGECAILVEVYDEYGDPVLNYGDFSDLEVGAYTITYAATNSLSHTTIEEITLTINSEEAELVLLYYTGFEDASKPAYASGHVNSEGVSWHFNDALVGNEGNDRPIGSKAVRIQKNGFIEMNDGLSQVVCISFWFSKYGTDAASDFIVSISKDGENWNEIRTAKATETEKTEVVVDIDYEVLANSGITRDTEVMFKFQKQGGGRLVIDEIKIYGYGNPQ